VPSNLSFSVAAEGPADFRTIGEALAAAGGFDGRAPEGRATIAVGPGVYFEKLAVWRPDVTIVGAGPDATIVRFNDCAMRPLPSGEPMRTFNSATLYVGAPGFEALDLSVENCAGDGRVVGQAVALYVDADRAAFRNCRFLARQDTICLGPLPSNPLPKGLNPVHPVHVAAPGDERSPFRNYFADCHVEGDIDFIFGSAAAVFERCEIVSLDRGEPVNGYVTAPSTLPGQKHGFVFLDCALKGRCADSSVFLGRPWRSSAKAAFIGCELGAHIAGAGWDNWDNPANEATAEFCEFGNFGPGVAGSGTGGEAGAARQRVRWAKPLNAAEAASFSRENVLSGEDGWMPWTTSVD
jgi:pectinesterase